MNVALAQHLRQLCKGADRIAVDTLFATDDQNSIGIIGNKINDRLPSGIVFPDTLFAVFSAVSTAFCIQRRFILTFIDQDKSGAVRNRKTDIIGRTACRNTGTHLLNQSAFCNIERVGTANLQSVTQNICQTTDAFLFFAVQNQIVVGLLCLFLCIQVLIYLYVQGEKFPDVLLILLCQVTGGKTFHGFLDAQI